MKIQCCLILLAVVVDAQVQNAGTQNGGPPFSLTFKQLEQVIPNIPPIARLIIQEGGGIKSFIPAKHHASIPNLDTFPSIMNTTAFVAALRVITPAGMHNTDISKWIPVKHRPLIQQILDGINARSSQNRPQTQGTGGWGPTQSSGFQTTTTGGWGPTQTNGFQTTTTGGWGSTQSSGFLTTTTAGWGQTQTTGGWGQTQTTRGWSPTQTTGGWGQTQGSGGFHTQQTTGRSQSQANGGIQSQANGGIQSQANGEFKTQSSRHRPVTPAGGLKILR